MLCVEPEWTLVSGTHQWDMDSVTRNPCYSILKKCRKLQVLRPMEAGENDTTKRLSYEQRKTNVFSVGGHNQGNCRPTASGTNDFTKLAAIFTKMVDHSYFERLFSSKDLYYSHRYFVMVLCIFVLYFDLRH